MTQTKKEKHIPMRMCIVTRKSYPKRELARFVYLAEEKKMVFDPKGKARGRGANLLKTLETFDNAVKSGAFDRALKTKISNENLSEVREAFVKYLQRQELGQEGDKVTVRIKTGEKVKLD